MKDKKEVKIGCFGNMNNNMFSLVRYLRDSGYDAELILYKGEYNHFFPECDTYTKDFKSYTHESDFTYFMTDLYFSKPSEIESAVAKYDVIIGCGQLPAYMEKINRKVDMFIPFGGDLFEWPFGLSSFFSKRLNKEIIRKFFRFLYRGKLMKKGIRNARYVICELMNDKYEHKIKPLFKNQNRLVATIPFIYIDQYNSQEAENYALTSSLYNELSLIRDQHDLLIIQHTQQNWFYKNNNILIEGFSKFLLENKGVKACLVLFEYGADVDKSKKLIEKLNVGDKIRWMPKSFRKDIMLCLKFADFSVGEFGYSYYSYGVVFESLAMGVPFIHYRNDALYKHIHADMYPMINANSAEELKDIFTDWRKRPEYYEAIGKAGTEWYMQNGVRKPVETIIKHILN
jgi:glycosyltransferase involved in cell wall biosynthesis